jgi:hypothetical protein
MSLLFMISSNLLRKVVEIAKPPVRLRTWDSEMSENCMLLVPASVRAACYVIDKGVILFLFCMGLGQGSYLKKNNRDLIRVLACHNFH